MTGLSVYDYNELTEHLKRLKLDDDEIGMVSNLVDGFLSRRLYGTDKELDITDMVDIFDEYDELEGLINITATPFDLLYKILH